MFSKLKKLSRAQRAALAISASLMVLLLIFAFGPLTFATSYAQKQVDGLVDGKSMTSRGGITSRQVVVFATESDGDVQAHFVNISRTLFGWRVSEHTIQEIDARSGDKNTDQIVAELSEAVSNGQLSGGDNVDIDSLSAFDRSVKGANDTSYSTLAEYTSADGAQKLSLGVNDQGSFLTLGGVRLPISGSVASPALSASGDRFCYTKFVSGDDTNPHEAFTGNVYCMRTDNLREELLFVFGEGQYMSLGLNDEYLVYTLANGSTGVVDLGTRQKTEIIKFEMITGSDPGDVVFVDEKSAVIAPNNAARASSGSERNITINLQTLEVE